MQLETFLTALSTLVILFAIYSLYNPKHDPKNESNLPLPPGPRPLPILGNIFNLPPKNLPEYQHWLKFKSAYGPISSVTVLGQPMVIIQDHEVAKDLLEKMSAKTSCRPRLDFADMCGFGVYFPMFQYSDERFKVHKRMTHQQFGTDKIAGRHGDVQDVESKRLLLRVLDEPGKAVQHLLTQASAIILKVTYDYSVQPKGRDPLVNLIEHMMDNFTKAFIPSSWLPNLIPMARNLPQWLPGLYFPKFASRARAINRLVNDVPYAFATNPNLKKQKSNKNSEPFVASLINHYSQSSPLDPDTEAAIKHTAAIMYAGSADTSSTAQTAFILAMMLFPEVQIKAQQELDSVLGANTLPTLDDRARLPYNVAVAKETLRWCPVAPVNAAHRTTQPIAYRGYYIPEGSYLLCSNWAILHDPNTYPDPAIFRPERFLGDPESQQPDPSIAAFGHGRRICPGRYLAEQSMFLTTSRLLATFSIEKDVDEKTGRVLEPKLELSAGLIARPKEFPFSIRPRSEEHETFVRGLEKEVPWEEGDAGRLGLDEELVRRLTTD